jgi:thiol:disulfide interchange protein DsbD
MTGALAAVVASPCTAPFMGTAVVFAITQPPLSALLVFLSLAFGMALPFLLIAFIPDIGKFLPKPGPWMDIFKQAMAFPLYLTAIWLLWVLGRQTDASIMALVLVGILLLLFAVWLRKVEAGSRGRWRHFKTALSLAAVAGSFAMLWLPGLSITSPQTTGRVLAQDSFWEPYSEERLAELRAQHRPVFLNITADWCISCIANERVALSMTSVRDAFREKNIAALKGDWTNNHPRITEILESFNRNGVPLYVLYPPGEDVEPIMLPQWLTPFNVISALESI